MTADLVALGKVGRPHGVNGEVRLFLFNPTSQTLSEGLDVVILRGGKELARPQLSSVRYTPKFAILKFKDLHFRDQVDTFKHAELAVPEHYLPELDDEEFYHRDILDLPVFLATEEDGEDFDPHTPFGVVDRIFETGANDVVVVKKTDGTELFVPLIEDAISLIDLDKEFVLLQPLEIWAPAEN